MASTPLKAWEKDRSNPRAYTKLSLERRLLVTPDTTINIASISRVVVTGTMVKGEKQMSLLAKLLIFAAPPLLTLVGLTTGSAIALSLLVLMAIGSATAGYMAPKEVIREDEQTHMLAVYTLDGGEFRFVTSNLAVLNNARTLIANRMTETGDGLPITIDFAKGVISTTAEAVVKQQQAANGAAAKSNGHAADDEKDDDDDEEKEEAAREKPSWREAAPPREPTLSRGPTLSLDPHLGERAAGMPIDYGEVLPSIEQWHRTAAGSRGWEEAADLLFELERLTKTGTPDPNQRARVRTLAIELSSRLNAYPQAIGLMQAVMRLSSS